MMGGLGVGVGFGIVEGGPLLGLGLLMRMTGVGSALVSAPITGCLTLLEGMLMLVGVVAVGGFAEVLGLAVMLFLMMMWCLSGLTADEMKKNRNERFVK